MDLSACSRAPHCSPYRILASQTLSLFARTESKLNYKRYGWSPWSALYYDASALSGFLAYGKEITDRHERNAKWYGGPALDVHAEQIPEQIPGVLYDVQKHILNAAPSRLHIIRLAIVNHK